MQRNGDDKTLLNHHKINSLISIPVLTCDDPGPLEHGTKFPSEVRTFYECGEFLNFTCDTGYQLTGDSAIRCGAMGFSSGRPECGWCIFCKL